MEMLTGYAAAHRHPVNVAVHLVGIPVIMLGVFVPLSWVDITVNEFAFTLAHVVLFAMFLFYLTLDVIFALVFLLFGIVITWIAQLIGAQPLAQSATIAAALVVGGYIAQFVGHAIERSMPVLLKHPVQANLAAPFFTIVEVFKLLGLREKLFLDVQARVEAMRREQAGTEQEP